MFIDIKRPARELPRGLPQGRRARRPRLPALREDARAHLGRHDGRDAEGRAGLRAGAGAAGEGGGLAPTRRTDGDGIQPGADGHLVTTNRVSLHRASGTGTRFSFSREGRRWTSIDAHSSRASAGWRWCEAMDPEAKAEALEHYMMEKLDEDGRRASLIGGEAQVVAAAARRDHPPRRRQPLRPAGPGRQPQDGAAGADVGQADAARVLREALRARQPRAAERHPRAQDRHERRDRAWRACCTTWC